MKTKQLLIPSGAAIGLTLVPILVLSCKQDEQTDKKPVNILFIMSDDHSYQTISAYGHGLNSTPNIDRIAREGVLFTNSFVANSLSGPSRACLLTGKHSIANGFTDNGTIFDGDQQTFPKLLQKAGYQTAIVGKWHLGSEPQGFDYWNILIGQGQYYAPRFIDNGDTTVVQGYATQVTADLTIKWLEEIRDTEKPFMLMMHNKAPHRPWQPDIQDLGAYDNTDFPLPPNFYDDYKGRKAAELQEMSIAADMTLDRDLKMGFDWTARMSEPEREAWNTYYDSVQTEFEALHLSGNELAEWKYQRYMRDYLGCINSVDRNVGRVLDWLEENGLLENTIIIYTSDQGFYMGEHGWFDKRFMYEESFRTPLLVRMPEGIRGTCSELVQNIDLAPTFLDIANVPIPEDIHGMSMLPVLQGKTSGKHRDALYYHYHEFPAEHTVRKHYGIRDQRYKLIRFYDDGVPAGNRRSIKDHEKAGIRFNDWELYDLKTDPSEMNNIYGKPGTRRVTRILRRKLEKMRQQYGELQ
ncbi:MAG: sulfatase [Bacteroidales bacterium]|nr:sulfatase [Bacteroidales bacterium]MDD2771940.1 sulfatase [Bacteroidales bacterium]MDD3105986.1 sulfatase [Bacteroidales bacterium]MDD4065280.1 sulfatase [Bacteroidales bacterium]MDY0240274.1 sulfatase [Bacteroidales bacterium]